MKKFLLSITFILSIILVTAQTWMRQHPFEQHGILADIDLDEYGRGWAVGEEGIILHSGNMWLFQESPEESASYTAVEIVPGTNAILA